RCTWPGAVAGGSLVLVRARAGPHPASVPTATRVHRRCLARATHATDGAPLGDGSAQYAPTTAARGERRAVRRRARRDHPDGAPCAGPVDTGALRRGWTGADDRAGSNGGRGVRSRASNDSAGPEPRPPTFAPR